MRVFLVAGGLVMAALAALILFGARDPDVPVSERAKRECQKIHPYSEVDANSCRIALLARYLSDTKDAPMERAYQRIR